MRRILSSLLVVVAAQLVTGAATAQVPDADCFSGACGGTKGIPRCPDGYYEVGWVLYANSKANESRDCETVVSCTNLGHRAVDISCRFFHGFNPIRPGGPTDALCSTLTDAVAPGDTTECATDAVDPPAYQAGGVFLAADGQCPTFEGKGLVCERGGNEDRVLCEGHLVCGGGAVLENVGVVRTPPSRREERQERE